MKKLIVCVFLFFTALTATFAASNSNWGTGKNNLPAALDRFPVFNCNEPVKQLDIHLPADVDKNDTYIKELQRVGFKRVDNGTEPNVTVYRKGSAEVRFEDWPEVPYYTVEFSLKNVNKPINDFTAAMQKAFPAYEYAPYDIHLSLTYAAPIPEAVLDGYIRALNAAGFEHGEVGYFLSGDEDDTHYFENESGKYTWGIAVPIN